MSSLSRVRQGIRFTRINLQPDGLVHDALKSVTLLCEDFLNYIEDIMDKKMAKVTRQMKTAGRDIKKGKKKAALKVLQKAEKKNVKLTKIDREVRDPIMKKYAKMKKRGCK